MRIAFSGSGLLFPVHFGAFTCLREMVPERLTAVSGTSGGSLIAAALACHTIADVNSFLYELDLKRYFEFNPTAMLNRGLSYGKAIQYDLDYIFGDLTFSETNMPLYVTASDVVTGKPFLFSNATTPDALITTALRASIAVPLVFTPVIYEDKILVDGSVHVPTPIMCFPNSEELTIGIRVKGKQNNGYSGLNYYTKILSMALSAVDNIHVEIDELNDNICLYFLDVDYHNYEAHDINELINEGLYAMREQFQNKLIL